MARPLRDVRAMPQYPPLEAIGAGVDGAQVAPLWTGFCWPPQGMNCSDDIAALAPGQPRWAVNMVPWPDSWRSRFPMGYVAATPEYIDEATTIILYARQVVDATGREWMIRWTTTGVDILQNGAWVACTGPALALSRYDKIAMTGWNTLVIFSDGASGMYALDMNARSYSLITGAPAAQHLTTFNARVIASVPFTSRIQWCVSRDYTDWTSTDLGAGYEDLLSSPEGSIDAQCAVLPISDEIAYCVRSNSIWQMEPTRNLAAPFAFSRVVAGLGSRWPATCVSIPGGIAFMNDRGVYLFRGGQIEDLTPPIRTQFTGVAQSVLRSAHMCYDGTAENLRLAGDWPTPTTDLQLSAGGYGAGGTLVWRWHFRIGGGWTVDRWEQGQQVRALSSTIDLRKRGTIGELTGTIGALEGVVGDLGVSAYQSGVLYVMYNEGVPSGTTNWVAREAPDFLVTSPSTFACEALGVVNGLTALVPLAPSVLVSGALSLDGHRWATVSALECTIRTQSALQTTTPIAAYGFDRVRIGGSPNSARELFLVQLLPLGTSARRRRFEFGHSGRDPWIQLSHSSNFGIAFTDLRLRVVQGTMSGEAP